MIGKPLEPGALHETSIFPSLAVRVGRAGRFGAPEMVMVFEVPDRSDSPSALTALTVKE